MIKRNRIYATGENHPCYKHGECVGKISRLYTVWYHMMERCYNQNDRRYCRYGGRGITVCNEWQNNEIFFNWAKQNGYTDNLTIDRINNDSNYCPENCQFITLRENILKRPKSINWGIHFHNDKYEVNIGKRINGIDKLFYGGRYLTFDEALRNRDMLYNKLTQL